MKKLFLSCLAVVISLQSFGWGQTGHRAIGQIAEWHLNKKAKARIKQILGAESVAMASVWMDEIRSDEAYDYTNTWHWVTIPDGQQYDKTIQEKGGDAYEATVRIIEELKAGGLTKEKEWEYVKFLIHMVGDLHQPLHVGRGDDRGGNNVRVNWFGQATNLHSVWDSKMIDGKAISYTELAQHLNMAASKNKIKEWQQATVVEWMAESMECRPMVYDVPEDKNMGYEYSYKYFSLAEERMLLAGIRLAGVLNEIYG
ncbi:S1/P1 nuclease [Penaeicola halotolerans]|uniref:S1/P1 nuclease n=1 Tax=Penaeicola halotolerans TaxID=2793196 RepID=UPI001CF893E3|nr:S1/P1 nuclease [Penaeicola halotolerans]